MLLRWSLLAASLASGTAYAGGAKLSVEVAGLRSTKGQVYCELFDNPKGWPGSPKLAFQETWVDIPQQKAVCIFNNLPPGNYAVAAYHDENGNRTLDQGFLGIPKEAIAISNDAKGFVGPPKFDAAKFPVGTQDVTIAIHLRY
jgi:uncharacterized protein (DUF2141 family)